jgi:predicted metal-binding membrane protein
MTEAADHSLPNLSPAASRLGGVFAQPKRIAAICIIALVGLGWLYLALMTASTAGPSGTWVGATWAALCSSTFGVALMPDGVWGVTGFALVALMWGAMTLAMMLPSAAPMILTYAEIADTAARKGEPVVSPFVLAAGYTLIWFGFAVSATVAQYALTRIAILDPTMTSVSGLFSGAIFIAAGVYQFSALKHACLRQCRSPFPFFVTNWATTPRGVFKLGLRQGLFCLGCCWAMMLVMFAVGIMNVIWMAVLGIVMTVEKIGTGKRFTYAIGVLSIAVGVGFIVASVIAHWPGRLI